MGVGVITTGNFLTIDMFAHEFNTYLLVVKFISLLVDS